jgi:hypothetical protein
VGGIFCNLDKAVDCVNHDLLMKKLKFYGIVGNANALIKSCLSDRYRRVLIDDDLTHSCASSEWGKLNHEVPQGSILGPVLFLFYVNDLHTYTYIHTYIVHTFADPLSKWTGY